MLDIFHCLLWGTNNSKIQTRLFGTFMHALPCLGYCHFQNIVILRMILLQNYGNELCHQEVYFNYECVCSTLETMQNFTVHYQHVALYLKYLGRAKRYKV